MRALAPLHPGIHLKEEMEYLGLTKKDTASALGISRQYLDKILNGNASITAPVAAHIAVAFGTTDIVWLNLQADYDLWVYRQEHGKELENVPVYA